MRIDHDKVSGALYIKLREGEYDHTEDFSERADVYLDVDAEGNVLGLEALSFEDLAQAIAERGGKLDVPDRIDPERPDFGSKERWSPETSGGARFEVYRYANGPYHWRFRAANGEIIVHSGEGYRSRDEAMRAIALFKAQSPGAAVEAPASR
jgi:uncharacterized protein YegP (UPF0339 family)/uncharacterized protein YuzE